MVKICQFAFKLNQQKSVRASFADFIFHPPRRQRVKNPLQASRGHLQGPAEDAGELNNGEAEEEARVTWNITRRAGHLRYFSSFSMLKMIFYQVNLTGGGLFK